MDPAIAHADLAPPRQPIVSRGLVPALLAHVLLGLALAANVNWKRAPDPSKVVAVPGLNAPAAATDTTTAGSAPAAPPPAVAAAPAPAPAPAAAAPATARAQEPAAEAASQRTTMGAPPAPAQEPVRPSFDCRKARSRVEKMICADPELSRLDRDLSRLHARAKAAAPDAAAFRRQNDAEWRLREQSCHDRECVLAWYAHRREQLEAGLQQASAR